MTDAQPFHWQPLCKQHANKHHVVPSRRGAAPINTIRTICNTLTAAAWPTRSAPALKRVDALKHEREAKCPTLQMNTTSLREAVSAPTLCLPTRDGWPLAVLAATAGPIKETEGQLPLGIPGQWLDKGRPSSPACVLGTTAQCMLGDIRSTNPFVCTQTVQSL